jgi:hypothetical protein
VTREVTSCSGAPRDLGFEQGRVHRNQLRNGVEQAGLRTLRRRFPTLRAWSSGPVLGAGFGQEMIRHYPHLSERMAGLALGADLPLESLVSYMEARETSDSPGRRPTRAVAVAGPGSWLAREFPGEGSSNPLWTLRRSQPEVGFASVEVTVPWLASAVAGVNEEGLAAVIVAHDSAGTATDATIALLLIQDCLQQFASLDGCLDWCSKRPSAGGARILFADATGEIASIDMDRRDRRIVRSHEGTLEEGMDAESLAVSAFDVGSRDVSEGSSPQGAWVRLIPNERRLVWAGGGADPTVLVAEPAVS